MSVRGLPPATALSIIATSEIAHQNALYLSEFLRIFGHGGVDTEPRVDGLPAASNKVTTPTMELRAESPAALLPPLGPGLSLTVRCEINMT